MPQTRVLFFRDTDGTVPVRDWLRVLRDRKPKGFAKCVVRIRRLAELGHELRRPEADLLEDGIYELRARDGTVNYRILYFYHGRNVAVLVHALTKEDVIPRVALDTARLRKRLFERDPRGHTFVEELTDA